MTMIYQNELVKVNKEVWEKDIRREIEEWIDFSNSIFCNTKERKASALKIVRQLHTLLETLTLENGVTQAQFDWFTCIAKG